MHVTASLLATSLCLLLGAGAAWGQATPTPERVPPAAQRSLLEERLARLEAQLGASRVDLQIVEEAVLPARRNERLAIKVNALSVEELERLRGLGVPLTSADLTPPLSKRDAWRVFQLDAEIAQFEALRVQLRGALVSLAREADEARSELERMPASAPRTGVVGRLGG